MPTTRRLLATTTLAAPALAGCGWFAAEDSWRQAVADTWRLPDPPPAEDAARLRELARLGTLAANGHNTQPWRFRLAPRRIAILPDPSRRTPVVDPDDHHLFASLGCAAETIVQAAPAFGLRATPRFDAATGAVDIALDPGPQQATPLFRAIATRQSTRGPYDGRPAATSELDALAAAGRADAVDCLLLTDRARIDRVAGFVTEGNTAQMTDRAFMAELKAWIRFDHADALATRDGLFSASSGNPVAPRWLGRFLFDLFVSAEAENAKYVEHLRSSAGVAVFAAAANDPAHWMEAGRACQRFALQAEALGITCAFLNQPLEVPAIRPRFAAEFGFAGRRPNLVLRFGRGPRLARSLRRPLPLA